LLTERLLVLRAHLLLDRRDVFLLTRDVGIARLLVTSASRDGSLAGPDLSLVDEVMAAGVPVLAAGGIASLDDLRALRRAGCEGAVAGSALLAGRFTLGEALAVAAE